MAGAGIKTFESGDLLTAADVNAYFMDQVIGYFESITAANTFFSTNPLRFFVGRTIYSAEDEALFVWDGAEWVNQVAIIGDNAVTSAKLRQTSGEEAVITDTIRDEAVTTDKIADKAVTAAKIGPVEISTVSSSRDLALSDYGKNLIVNSSSLVEITIRDTGTIAYPIGMEVYITRYGTGAVTFVESSTTILSDTDRKSIKTQYSSASLLHVSNNNWLLTGNLAD